MDSVSIGAGGSAAISPSGSWDSKCLLLALLLAGQLLSLQTTGSETLAPGIPSANTTPADLLRLMEAVLSANQKIEE